MSFRKSIYFRVSVPILLAPFFALAAIALVENFGVETIGAWSSKLTFMCGLISGPIVLAISKFRDLCTMEGMTEAQRAELVSIVRKRTLRFWFAFLFLVAVFLTGFSISAFAESELAYLVAVGWITAFFFTLYILAISHFWLDEAEDFKLKIGQHLRDERERTELIQTLQTAQGDKIHQKSELEQYNKVFDPKSGAVQ